MYKRQRPGRQAVRKLLPDIVSENNIEFTIANAENASGGRGLTREVMHELLGAGIDVLTMGNHVWDNKEILSFIDEDVYKRQVDHEVSGPHIEIGVDLAKKYRESKDVIHAIAAHHGDVDPESIEAVLVQAGDAISASRPGARRETLEAYIKRLEKLENLADSFTGCLLYTSLKIFPL